jgi:GNAT superfamily N-acetyltransferase
MCAMLDNPLWSALTTRHRAFARGAPAGEALRYPADVAPFLAVSREGAPAGELVAAVETLYAVGPAPSGCEVEPLGNILQMVCAAPPAVPEGPPVVVIDRVTDVLALAAMVYPHFVRPRTPELGRYFGVYEGTRLAAMAGERMAMPGYQEISAVCAHPDFGGRGLARRVFAYLTAHIAARGETPFLHVSPGNTRAIALYERNGYRTRAGLAFAALRRRGITMA